MVACKVYRSIDRSEPDAADDGGKLLLAGCGSVARAKALIEQLAAGGLGGGDGSRTPEPAVLGPRGRRDDRAATRPAAAAAGAHHHAVVVVATMGAAGGAEAHHPVDGGAQPRGRHGGLMNEAGHLLLHHRAI